MCNRYTVGKSAAEIIDKFDAMMIAEIDASYNIAPTQQVAIVTQTDARVLETAKWGLIPSWAKDPKIGARMTNARAETVAEKPAFRSALVRRRCLIPADGFYEWQARLEGDKGKKQPYYFHLLSGDLFAFAGLWEAWRDPAGDWLKSCSIITTTANEVVEPIHDRMPVILRPEDIARWLNPETYDASDLLPMLAPYPVAELEAYPVGTAVNSPTYNTLEAVQPLNSA
ncbi:MAG: SOS response-associated peptidase [Capsulimonas sp.]|uniref:SOS response-associated peptidase n=1 Tax=Capsulimonas sp. TaxID=2494211 RepID=UPI0032665D4E